MKKTGLFLLLFTLGLYKAQFNVKIEAPKEFLDSDAYLYSLNGSKDIIVSKALKEKDIWLFKVPQQYEGMMKIYFPQSNATISFISENKDVDIAFTNTKNKITNVNYKDITNSLFYSLQDQQKKKEQILPALYQIQTYYKDNSTFGNALKNEIENLDTKITYNPVEHPFIDYYNKNYNQYLIIAADKLQPTNDQIINFFNTTTNYLESSSLMKPILMAFLSGTSKSNIDIEVDKLLKTVNIETPRGQTILSELIEIFNAYGIKNLKEKYLTEAQSLKCTINDRLSTTIKSNQDTAVGKKIPNNIFVKPTHTTAKSLYDIKADKKVIILWASTCPHCEKEISQMISKYDALKAKNVEIVGLSLDTDVNSYSEKVKILPWINDTELKGWYSSYVDTYNVHATPTFYIVDAQNKIVSNPDNFLEVLEFLGVK